MKSVEDLTKELDEKTKKALEQIEALSNTLKEFDDIDIGEVETDEDKNNQRAFYAAVNVRRQGTLRRLLSEWGGLLFF